MHKYLKKLIFISLSTLSLYFVSAGFVEYFSLDWNVAIEGTRVETIFKKFKHIKYPLIFSRIKNRSKISEDTKRLNKEISQLDSRIVKVFSNASSLFYLDYLPLEPIEKDFNPIDPIELASLLNISEPTFAIIGSDQNSLSLHSSFKTEKYTVETKVEPVVNWQKYYEEIGIESEILSYAEFFNNKPNPQKEEDLVKLVQSATKRSSKSNKASKETDDLVFFSYQEKKKEDEISSVVLKAIEREMNKDKAHKIAKASRPKTVGGYTIATPEKIREKKTRYKAKSQMLETEVVTIGVQIDKGIMDQVSGIEFVPHYDKNERVYDEAEGILRLSSNLKQSNFIYGTILGKDFVNMRTSIPLFLGGGMFEVPMLEKEALNKLLDKEKLNGIGSHLLVDLGDNAIDVDIDKEFEARTFLNDDFKVTTQEKSYKYILYIGVEPGNAVVRYLDSKGSTHEKLSFLAESELTFEHFSQRDPLSFRFETFELSPLSKNAKELAMSKNEISLFGKKQSPKQIGINSFEYERYTGLESSNSYLEFNHLGDSIFAGMRFSNYVILPSSNFIESVLRARGLDSLSNHCMIQLNLSEPVKNILFDGEDRVGPMDVKLHYLDEDGVLSEEPSLLTKHAFLVGVGQGVINMQVEFLGGSKLVAQSFCSDGTYLVEQL